MHPMQIAEKQMISFALIFIVKSLRYVIFSRL